MVNAYIMRRNKEASLNELESDINKHFKYCYFHWEIG